MAGGLIAASVERWRAMIDLLILQATPFCNISCKYCYLPDRSSKQTMTLATMGRIFSALFSSEFVGDNLDICWHAGEPLVLPIDYYRQAFDVIDKLTPAGKTVQHCFQTNAMMVNDDWGRLFKSYGAKIGVSIDGPAEINDVNRRTRSGQSTFAKTLAGIKCLQRNDVEFSVITVLSDASLDKARELFDFYTSEGIRHVCFNIEEIEGCNTRSSLNSRQREIEFERFMREFWNLTVDSGRLHYVREFTDMLNFIVRPAKDGKVYNSMVTPLAIVTVDWEGNFSTFSPELLGQKSEEYGDFIIGNFWKDSLEDGLSSSAFQRLHGDVAAGVELCRNSCAYFSVCGGGSPVNKFYENGKIASCETMYCRLNVKTIANIAMDIIDNSAESLDAKDAAALLPYDLYILGSGISVAEHLTLRTIELMRTCSRIYTNLSEAELQKLPEDIRPSCVSLWHLYQDNYPRVENYRRVIQAVIDAAAVERPIAWLTPGHPRIFDSVSEELVTAGRARGWRVHVAPAISCLDTLLCEVGYDPAGGLLIHEATALVAERISPVPSIALLLLQPGAFGTGLAHLSAQFPEFDLTELKDHLSRFYSPQHNCAFVQSATEAGAMPRIFWVRLHDLASVPYARIAGSTLFLPAAEAGSGETATTVNEVAIAASMALPPAASISAPAAEASG
jgi:uncharacterized protein